MTETKAKSPKKGDQQLITPGGDGQKLATTEGTSLVPADLQTRQLSDGARLFLDEAKGPRAEPSRVSIIKIDHDEGRFKLPSGDLADEIAGFVVYYYQTRQYYSKPPRAGEPSHPPDCWSPDLLKPDPSSAHKQAERCATCPHSQWGTARGGGGGQNCATKTWLFILNPVFGNPPLAVLVAPPSSIRAILGTRFEGGYLARAIAKYGVYEIVWTKFRLEKGGDRHYVIEPHMVGCLSDPDKIRLVAKWRNDFLQAFDAMRGAAPDIDTGDQDHE